MCGIVGMYSAGKPIVPAALGGALDALAHRGPDGWTTWVSANGTVGLGHRRLAIIDLETGAQPLASENGEIQIIVNGEFYDYERIRRELVERGHVFRTQSDCEIAVHLYQELGLDFCRHLRGEFAFVLWDEARQRLVAGRDRFGIKPLFYSVYQDTLYLASEVKALFAAGIPAAWDSDAVYRQLFLCYAPDHAMFRNVQQVPAGTLLIQNSEARRLQKYWDFSFPRGGRDTLRESPAERVEHTRALVEEAVRLRLRADVPVGVMLSGGLDSTALLGFASSMSARPPTAFSIGFDDAVYDESAKAERAARYYGAEFHPLCITENQIVAHMEDSGWHGEMVQYNAHGTARYLLSETIRDAGYKVVLGGEGADEVFAGYEIMQRAGDQSSGRRAILPWLGPLVRLAQRATPAQRQIGETSPWLARMLKLADLPSPLQTTLGARLGMLRGLLAPDFLTQFRKVDPYRDLFDSIQGTRQLPGREYARQVTYVWLKTFFANYHLGADRLDMAHSVETRLPFLDHPLFEYVSQLPMSALAAPGREKALLRDAAKPFIPEWIYNARKKGFMAPPIDFRPGRPLNQFVQGVLRDRATTAVPFLNSQAIASTLDTLSSMPAAERVIIDPILMMLTSFSVLHRRFRL